MKKPEIISSAVASTRSICLFSWTKFAKEPAPLVPSHTISRITSSGSYAPSADVPAEDQRQKSSQHLLLKKILRKTPAPHWLLLCSRTFCRITSSSSYSSLCWCTSWGTSDRRTPPSLGEDLTDSAPLAPPLLTPSLELPPLAPIPPSPDVPAEEPTAESSQHPSLEKILLKSAH